MSMNWKFWKKDKNKNKDKDKKDENKKDNTMSK